MSNLPTETPLLKRLNEQRIAAAYTRKEILERASDGEEMSARDNEAFDKANKDIDRYGRLIADEIRRLKADEDFSAEVRASGWNVPRGQSSLSKANKELDEEFRALGRGATNRVEVPIEGARTNYQPGIEHRDLMKVGGTGTQSFSVNVYNRIVEHMVESSAVIKAGATVLNTPTGEDLLIPKTTGLATSAIVLEGGTFTESDPTLGNVTLKAFKYGHVFDVSYELLQDGHTDLLNVIARLAAESLVQAFGNDLINGTGGGTQPRGILADAGLGKQGPATSGVVTAFGTQSAAGSGTDLFFDTLGALAEPYANSANLSWLMRNSTMTTLRKLKDSAGNPVPKDILPGSMYVDPWVPAQAASAKSVIVGDFSRYVIRFAGPIRFERSDEFKFNQDLVTFKVAVRLDAATVDSNAFKYFQQAAT